MIHPRNQISKILKESESFLIASHEGPDGDAIGSMAALGHLLHILGKDVKLYNVTGLPERFSWLELPDRILNAFPPTGYDWIITLDSADIDRLGKDFANNAPRDKIINIDHHQGNPGFGAINWVDPNKSSVGEMVALLAQDLDVGLTGPLGEAVYLAIATDTGSFSFGNTKPETMEMVASILRGGLEPGLFNALMQSQWTLNKVHLQGMALKEARLHLGGKVALVSVSRAMLQHTGTTAADCEGLVNFMRQIKGSLVGVSLREEADGTTKFSLRSWGETDVRSIAARFGGGGHVNASGGRIEADPEQAETWLVKAIGDALELA